MVSKLILSNASITSSLLSELCPNLFCTNILSVMLGGRWPTLLPRSFCQLIPALCQRCILASERTLSEVELDESLKIATLMNGPGVGCLELKGQNSKGRLPSFRKVVKVVNAHLQYPATIVRALDATSIRYYLYKARNVFILSVFDYSIKCNRGILWRYVVQECIKFTGNGKFRRTVSFLRCDNFPPYCAGRILRCLMFKSRRTMFAMLETEP